MNWSAWGGSQQGAGRKENQDAWDMDEKGGLFVLSDGMGGHADGGAASRAVVAETLCASPPGATHPGKDWLLLKERVERAHARVLSLAEQAGHAGDMGATLVGLWLNRGRYILATVGDSRAYLFRNKVLSQLNEDHTVVQTYVNSGMISREEAETHPQRHLLRQAMGVGEVRPDFFEGQTQPGDKFLLTSDGVHGPLGDKLLGRVLGRENNPEAAGQALLRLVSENQGDDDATVVVVMLEREGG